MPVFLLVAVVAIVVSGIWATVPEAPGVLSEGGAPDWQATEGVVVSASSERYAWHAGAGLHDDEGPGTVVRFTPRIVVDYGWDGVRRTTDDYAPGQPAFTEAEIGALLASYPVGAEVTVWVDPEDPTHAVLDPDAWLRVRGYGFVGVGLLLLFGIAAAIGLIQWHADRR